MKFDDGIKENGTQILRHTVQYLPVLCTVRQRISFKEAYVLLEQRPKLTADPVTNTLVKKVNEYMDDFASLRYRSFNGRVPGRASEQLVCSSASPFLKGEYELDKICAYQTPYECLETLVKLMALLSPFFSDAVP